MSQRHTLEPLKLPLAGSHLIEASAGTGKTFTIALLYVRLVLGQAKLSNAELAAGLLPQNLLVVTFTEAATKELRERIRKRLTQAAEVFAGTVERDSDNGVLFELREQFDESEYKTQQAKGDHVFIFRREERRGHRFGHTQNQTTQHSARNRSDATQYGCRKGFQSCDKTDIRIHHTVV